MTAEDFKKCFGAWFDEIRNYLSYRCGDTDLATDLVQEAFTKVWQKNIAYQIPGTKSLLYKIATELYISHYRKQQVARKHNFELQVSSAAVNTTELDLAYQETKAQYEQALLKMEEKQRTVFLLSRIDGLTYTEIAQHLALSVKAVEKRMSKAIHELRQTLNYVKR